MARLEPATGENRQWTVYHIFTLGRYLVLFFSFLSRKKRRDSNSNMRKKNLQRQKARSDDMARLEPATGENRQWTVYHIFTLGRCLVLFFSSLLFSSLLFSSLLFSSLHFSSLLFSSLLFSSLLFSSLLFSSLLFCYHIFTLGRYLVLFSSLLCSPLSLLSYPILSYPILDLAHRRADYRFRFYMFLVEALIASAVIYT